MMDVAGHVNAAFKGLCFRRFEKDLLLAILPDEPQNVEGGRLVTDPSLRHSEFVIRQSGSALNCNSAAAWSG